MKMGKNRLDDSLCAILVAVGAVLAVGMQVSVSKGYVLDRGAVQARADEQAAAVRLAQAASEAARRNAIVMARRDALPIPAVGAR